MVTRYPILGGRWVLSNSPASVVHALNAADGFRLRPGPARLTYISLIETGNGSLMVIWPMHLDRPTVVFYQDVADQPAQRKARFLAGNDRQFQQQLGGLIIKADAKVGQGIVWCGLHNRAPLEDSASLANFNLGKTFLGQVPDKGCAIPPFTSISRGLS